LPAFFWAQWAFNLADNFALVAGLTRFILAFAAGLTERVAGFARRRFTHLAAAIFFLTEALIVLCAVRELAGAPR